MIILPAIDLKDGNCVRLVQGRADAETIYGDNPAAVAIRFQSEGAKMLHLVDLDGAFHGKTANLEAIKAIRAAVDLPLELGGGMRAFADVEGMLALGIDSIIVGTMAVRAPEVMAKALDKFGGERVQLGVDAREGKVSVQGWGEDTSLDAIEFAQAWKARGVARVIFTDISRDGMMQGPNIEATRQFATGAGLKVTASGGVSCPADLTRLGELEPLGVDRAIVGKAIYEGAVRMEELV